MNIRVEIQIVIESESRFTGFGLDSGLFSCKFTIFKYHKYEIYFCNLYSL